MGRITQKLYMLHKFLQITGPLCGEAQGSTVFFSESALMSTLLPPAKLWEDDFLSPLSERHLSGLKINHVLSL